MTAIGRLLPIALGCYKPRAAARTYLLKRGDSRERWSVAACDILVALSWDYAKAMRVIDQL